MAKSSRLRSFLICFVIALGAAIVYAPVAHFGFLTIDDPLYISENFYINHGFSWKVIPWSFNLGYGGNWHPLTWLSLCFDCQFFGLNPGPMHLDNLVLHILASILLFSVFQGMTGKTWRSAFVAALFAWHPIHVESVAWITERKDVLSGLFFVLTLWAWWRYVRNSKTNVQVAVAYYLAALIFFALGLMAKPMLVTLPFLLLLLDAWPLARLPEDYRKWVSLIPEKIPFFIFAAVSSVLTYFAQARQGAVMAQIPFHTRLVNAVLSVERYVDKLVWPSHLNALYQYNYDLSPLSALWPLVFVAVVSAICLYSWKSKPYLLIGWLWFLGTLVPVIGLVQVGGQAMADRYMYIPSIGLFAAICWAVSDFVENDKMARLTVPVIATGALVACLFLTRAQVMTWRDTGSVARQAIDCDPENAMAYSVLASYLIESHQYDEAIRQSEAALKIFPNYAPAQDYLGAALYFEGRYAEAEQHLRRALEVSPNQYDARFRLANLYLATRQPDSAIEQFKTYLARDAADPRVHYGLGKAYAMQGDLNDAVVEFIAALKIAYNYPEDHLALASALERLGRPADAILEYRRVLQLDTNNLESLNNLAWLLSVSPDPSLRNGTNAVELAQRACELTTNRQPIFIGTLAAAYAEAGRYDDAVAAAQKAHDLALTLTNQAVADRNLQMLQLYQSRRPFHEK